MGRAVHATPGQSRVLTPRTPPCPVARRSDYRCAVPSKRGASAKAVAWDRRKPLDRCRFAARVAACALRYRVPSDPRRCSRRSNRPFAPASPRSWRGGQREGNGCSQSVGRPPPSARFSRSEFERLTTRRDGSQHPSRAPPSVRSPGVERQHIRSCHPASSAATTAPRPLIVRLS